MPRLDYRVQEKDIEIRDLVRAFLRVALREFNRLRAFHGLPALTMDQLLTAIKDELKRL